MSSVSSQDLFDFYYGDGQTLTEGHDIQICSDGSYIFVGSLGVILPENLNDPRITKLDDKGIVEWTFDIDMGGLALYDQASHIIEVSDGYVASGNYNDPTTFRNIPYLIKVDFDGNLLWAKDYPLQKDVTFGQFIFENDHFFISGYEPNANNEKFPALFKCNAGGEIVWSKKIGNESAFLAFAQLANIVKTSDGKLILGYLTGNSKVFKTDFDGNIEFQSQLNSPGGVVTILERSDKKIIVLCSENLFINPSQDFLYILEEDLSIARLNILDFNTIEASTGAVIDDENNIYISGSRFTDDVGVFVKYDTELNYEFHTEFQGRDDLEGTALNNIQKVDNQNYILIGNGLQDGPGTLVESGFAFVTRVNNKGSITTGNESIFLDTDPVHIFPNPSMDQIHFNFESNQNIPRQLIIYNALGQLIKNIEFNKATISLDKTEFGKGLFFYSILDRNQAKSSAGKIIFN